MKARALAPRENGLKLSAEFFILRDNQSIEILDEIERPRRIDEIGGPRFRMAGEG